MDRKEQDILNMIKEQTEEIKVPESLEPEAIRLKLDAQGQKKNRRKIYQFGGVAAACVVLAAGIFSYQYMQNGSRSNLVSASGNETKISEEETIASAESYEQIYSYMYSYMKENKKLNQGAMPFAGAKAEEVMEESVVNDMSAKTSGREQIETGSCSATNVRQEGVDEADVAKTDGAYLYVLKDDGKAVSIVDVHEQMKESAVIVAEKDSYIEEFYMLPEEKKLVLICTATPEFSSLSLKANVWENTKIIAVTYDVSDALHPEKDGIVTQSGTYHSSRFSDGYLYLFSQYYPRMEIEKSNPDTFVPLINGKAMPEQDIYMPLTGCAGSYEVVTAVDITAPDKTADSKAIFTTGGELYVSNNNIYYYEQQWNNYGTSGTTSIRKISYKEGELKAVAQGSVPGYINDSFSIDEYKGNLRVVVTVDETNSVYVLNKELKRIGKIEGLAKDERIYSARFMGDTGYFVTFRETDPLFSVDLSDPKNPKILGALKIPGFSEYLHFYGEGKLLGIGMDVDEKTGVTGGVKLTMFDISDKTDVKEADTYVLENVYSTDLFYDYKSAMIDVNKNMIGFAVYPEGTAKYYLFHYDQKGGFQCDLEETINGNASRAARGIYIDKTLYVIQGNVIEAYSLEDYKKVDDLIL